PQNHTGTNLSKKTDLNEHIMFNSQGVVSSPKPLSNTFGMVHLLLPVMSPDRNFRPPAAS
ncbi:MAG: hypothetical protein WKI04_12800, partial [Ferruginibacter sp.]